MNIGTGASSQAAPVFFMVYNNTYWHRMRVLYRIGLKALYRLLGPLNRSLQPRSFFGIKRGYHHAVNAENFDAVNSGEEWQREVYEAASFYLGSINGSSVIDVGCGSGFKLLKYFQGVQITGIEVEPTYSWLRDQYPERQWLEFGSFDPAELSADLVICADVIEHMADPGVLMNFIRKFQFRILVLSTPERDNIAGTSDYGPPENTAHYREWSSIELAGYVSEFFEILEHRIFPGKSTTQVLICSPK